MQTGTAKAKAGPDWDPQLDAVIAAPDHHTVLFEDEDVRVLRTHIPPGEMTKLHTHRWSSTQYCYSFSHFVRRNERAEIVYDSRTAAPPPPVPFSMSVEPLGPHSLQNVGKGSLTMIVIERRR